MRNAFWLTVGVVVGFAVALFLVKPHVAAPPVVPTPLPCVPVAKEPVPLPPPKTTVIGAPSAEEAAPVAAMAGPDLLKNLSFVEIRGQCDKAEHEWLKHNFDSYALAPKNDAEKAQYAKQLFEQSKDSLRIASWFKGEMDLGTTEHSLHLEVILKIYGAHDAAADPFKSNALAKIASAEDLCFALSPFVTVDGKMDTASVSVCGGPERKRGDVYYLSYNAYTMAKLAPAATILLFPLPTKVPASLEMLGSVSSHWVSRPEFVWKPSSLEEWQELHDRYLRAF